MNLSTVVLAIAASTDGNIQSASQKSRICHALAFGQVLSRCLVHEETTILVFQTIAIPRENTD